MISAILFISFFIFLILGIPIGICLGLSSICCLPFRSLSCPEISWQRRVSPNG